MRQEVYDHLEKEHKQLQEKYNDVIDGKLIVCRMCRKPKSNKMYYTAVNTAADTNGSMSICSTCLNQYCDNILKESNDNYTYAVTQTCKMSNIVYDEYSMGLVLSHITKYKNDGKPINKVFGIYKKFLSTTARQNTGLSLSTFADSVYGELFESALKSSGSATEDDIKFWGSRIDSNDYYRLNEIRSDYNQYEQNTPVQKTIIKTICDLTLKLEKVAVTDDAKKYEQTYRLLSMALNDGNLKPIQETGANATEKTSFGVFMKKMESEHPIPESIHENQIVKLLRGVFIGHLGRLFGFKTPFDDDYKKYIKKYEIDIQSYSEEEDGDDGGV